jgi:peptidoglycan pentaglycine glycine transferase (the second and third glycine)
MKLAFVEVKENEYKEFHKHHQYRNFMNSCEMIKLKRKRGSETEYLGVKNGNEYVAMCTICYQPLMKKYTYACIQRGILIDYQDKEVFNFFMNELKKHLHKKGCIYLHMDPYIIRKERDINGDEIEEGFNNEDVITTLQNAGFQHQGFTVGNSSKYQPRWTFVLPLTGKSKDDILANMHKRTRYNIHKAMHDEVCIKELTSDDLSIYLDIMEHTGERRHFDIRDRAFYMDYLNAYGKHAKLLLAYLDIPKYIEKQKEYQEESIHIITKHEELLDSLSEKKCQKCRNIIKAEQDKIQTYQNNIDEVLLLKRNYGNEVPLSACIFVIQDDEIVYLFGGSYKDLLKYKANYALQWHMIQLALKKGCTKYNFYGISGDFSEDADDYGIFKFKQGFDGHVEELIGDFILPIKKGHYKLYHLLKG